MQSPQQQYGFQSYQQQPDGQQQQQQYQPPQRMVFDGKRMRKPIQRKTVDYNSTIISYLESRKFQRDRRDFVSLQPSIEYLKDMLPPSVLSPVTSLCTKFVHTSTNKVRCPVNCVTWTPEGRRLITGSSSGEFTLWNGLTFNFETILQAHETAVRTMVWSHNDNWLVTGDHSGNIKYWQSNMNNVKAFQAHKEAVRKISFCPTDLKFASCSDDVTLKIWDFARCKEEHILTGHGWDVKCVDWHPQKSLVVSGSKDNLIKLWDPKSGKNVSTIHGHKNTVLQVRWNQNGNWLVSGSRDQLLKLYDIRTLKEMQTFKGHKKEVTAIAWHPFHEDLVVSGGFDGSIMYWIVGEDEAQAEIAAHESSVWDLSWHPGGHILCSGSNDHTTKFWCRNRPGDVMKDKYNVIGGKTHEQPETVEPVYNERDMPTVSTLPGIQGGPNQIPGVNPQWGEDSRERSRDSRDGRDRDRDKRPRQAPPPNYPPNMPPPNMMPPPHMMPPPGYSNMPPPNIQHQHPNMPPPHMMPPNMLPSMPPPGYPMPYPPNMPPPHMIPPPGPYPPYGQPPPNPGKHQRQ